MVECIFVCLFAVSEIYLEPNETAYGYTPFANGLIRIAFIRGNEFLMNNNNIPIGGSILIGDVVTGEVARESGQRVSSKTYFILGTHTLQFH